LKNILQNFYWWGTILFCILSFSYDVHAQSGFASVLTAGNKELTVSVNGSYFTRAIAGIDNSSKGLHLKALYGLVKNIDVWASVGLVDLTLNHVDSTGLTLRDNTNLSYGAGLNVKFVTIRRAGLWFVTGVSYRRFVATAKKQNSLFIGNSEVRQALELRYDWQIFNANIGMVKQFTFMNFYAGLNLRQINRPETKSNKLTFGSESVPSGVVTGEYKSGVIVSPALGVDFKFESRIKLSLGLTVNSRSDYTFSVGISQTGKP